MVKSSENKRNASLLFRRQITMFEGFLHFLGLIEVMENPLTVDMT